MMRQKKCVKRCLFIFIALFALTPAQSSFAVEFSGGAQLSAWVMNYYISPKPQEVKEVLVYYSDSEIFEDEKTRDMMAVFFGQIYKTGGDLMRKDFEALTKDGSDNARIVFLNSLWFADTEESRRVMQSVADEWLSADIQDAGKYLKDNPPPDLLKEKPVSARDLDLLWSMFFASGNEATIRQIISALEYRNSEDMNLEIVYGAARWSLGSTAETDLKVYEICARELNTAQGSVKEGLQEILSQFRSSVP